MTDFQKSDAVLIETNLDDENPEITGWIMDQLFSMGALDVYLTPVHMKKNRPGVILSVLADESNLEALSEKILRETSSLGLRIQPVKRIVLPRRQVVVETPFGSVEAKLTQRPGGVVTGSPEFESCRQLAEKNSIPIRQVYQAAGEAIGKCENIRENFSR